MTERLASRKGFEPLTYGLGNRCSILLSYRDSRRDLSIAPALFAQSRAAFKSVRPLLGLALALFPAQTRAAGACPPPLVEAGVVASVGDRYEITMQDGRVLQPAHLVPFQPGATTPRHAGAARSALATWLVGKPLQISALPAPSDRWGRQPVHMDGGLGVGSVAEALLSAGLARYLPSPADPCRALLLAAEARARKAALGLWADPVYAIVAAENPATLATRSGEFVLVEGRIARLGQTSARFYLNFGPVRGVDFTVSVSKAASRAFERQGMAVFSLVGKRIRVRGILDTRSGPQMDAYLPDAIERIER